MGKKFNNKCPECSSKNVIPIEYGMPGLEMREEADRGEIVLGGCCIMEDANNRHCKDCSHEWDKDTEYCTKCRDVVMYCDCYKSYIEHQYDEK